MLAVNAEAIIDADVVDPMLVNDFFGHDREVWAVRDQLEDRLAALIQLQGGVRPRASGCLDVLKRLLDRVAG